MDAASQRNKLILITALISIAVTSIVWIGIGVTGYWLINRESPQFGLLVDHPNTVTVGDVFKLKVTVSNDGSDDITLADLDVYETLTDGFEIISVNPKPRSTSKIFGMLTHEFSQSLAPAESIEIEFEMKAEDVGLWSGDIDVCTPSQNFVTHYTEIEVVDAPAAPVVPVAPVPSE